MKYKRPRGTQDIVPPDIDAWRAVERAFEETFDRYAYHGIRTPIFESTDLFVRAVGEESDIVTKEMYTFQDRGGRSLTLRPENTASVIRAYLENGLHRRGGLQRLCYFGPMFRYDRPQAGRYRQFHQVGAEAIGSDNPAVDVEMIQVVVESLGKVGFSGLDLRLNSVGTEASRGPYRDVLRHAIAGLGERVADSVRERYVKNPLRIFDAKEVDPEIKQELPVISEYLVDEDAEHFARVCELLDGVGIAYEHDTHLVRGLDYYTRTVFEVYYGEQGAQSALCGGGRYDNLVAECGGPDTPAIGFSAGLERVIDALPERNRVVVDAEGDIRYYVACVGDGAVADAFRAAGVVRRYGNAEVDLSLRSRKKQIQVAEKSKARAAVVLDEAAPGIALWYDLSNREEIEVPMTDLDAFVSQRENGEGDEG